MAYKFNPFTGKLDDYGPILTGTGTVAAAGDGTAALPGIAFASDLNTGIYRPGNDQLAISTGALERARIDSSGRLLVGTSSAVTGVNQPQYARLQVVGNTLSGARAGLIALGRSAAASTILAGDQLGGITFGDNAAGEFAYIFGVADGTAGTNDYPGRLVFSTTADGAATPTERFRITNDGVIAHDQPAPAAVNATATLTIANLKAGIITSTSAAATDMTLPSGTDTEAGFGGVYNNFTFEWSVINTGPSLVRVLAGTAHTIVGSGSVATGTSGRFASRRTAANTFVSYRLN